MKKLLLIRHGEAGFSDGTDFQRQLTDFGIEKVKRVGKTLQSTQPEIDFMYCSPAQRTRETAEILGSFILIKAYDLQKSIYEGDLGSLMELIENIPEIAGSCLIVGHNPIISLLLSTLTDSSYQNMTPGTLAIIEFEFDSWKLVSSGTGILREIIS
ncbi:SixA phosphatase family protein [Algoriphagus sp. PAP.12]|uniref:SixA phosphatase family protein n=1 Tax=Algoriphagus sp. PAP.12 TaxID=2996678 RepID=UPI00227A689B|nr:histidine phosphatase family protein [Algoriphagus sp. PAP.12]